MDNFGSHVHPPPHKNSATGQLVSFFIYKVVRMLVLLTVGIESVTLLPFSFLLTIQPAVQLQLIRVILCELALRIKFSLAMCTCVLMRSCSTSCLFLEQIILTFPCSFLRLHTISLPYFTISLLTGVHGVMYFKHLRGYCTG